MSRAKRPVALLVLIFISAVALASGAEAPQAGHEAAIRQVVQRLEDGWNAGDAKAFAAPFAPDADYVVVNGMHIKGRDEIDKGHAGIFAAQYRGSRNAATVKGVRFLRPDVAVVHVEWNLEHKVGEEARKSRAMNTMVMTREGAGWSIAAFHNTPVMAQGGR